MKVKFGTIGKNLIGKKSNGNAYSSVSVDSRLSGVSSQGVTENHYSLGDPTKTANGMYQEHT
jgi:hypothetical protein